MGPTSIPSTQELFLSQSFTVPTVKSLPLFATPLPFSLAATVFFCPRYRNSNPSLGFFRSFPAISLGTLLLLLLLLSLFSKFWCGFGWEWLDFRDWLRWFLLNRWMFRVFFWAFFFFKLLMCFVWILNEIVVFFRKVNLEWKLVCW